MIQEINRIPLEGVYNTRDLGGFHAADSRSIKPHRLIRSGELSRLTENDKRVLTEEYNLTAVVDFRTPTEQAESPDPRFSSVTYISNPILEEKALGITREKEADNDVVSMVLGKLKGNQNAGLEYMQNMYRNLITNDFSKKQYGNFFRILLEHEDGAVLWHCTAGKDRAGTGAALLLEILGVPRNQIVADYLKVNEFAAEGTNRTVNALLEKTGNLELAEQLRTLFRVQESYINTIFDIIDTGYGSIEQYLKEEMGIYPDGVSELKYKYLE